MKKESLILALEYLAQAAQIWKDFPKGYLEFLYSELANIYTDEQIMAAAKTIAQTTNLYGRYPTLREWLDYCPARRAERISDSVYTADFMEEIDYIIYGDTMLFNLDSVKKRVWEKFGERARCAVSQFGGIRGIRATGYKASQFEQESLRRQIKLAWDESKKDVETGILKITSQVPELLENKFETNI